MQSKKLPLLTTFVCAALVISMMIGCDGSDDAKLEDRSRLPTL